MLEIDREDFVCR